MSNLYEYHYKKNTDGFISTERKKVQADDIIQATNAIYGIGIEDSAIVCVNVIATNDDVVIANMDTMISNYNMAKNVIM